MIAVVVVWSMMNDKIEQPGDTKWLIAMKNGSGSAHTDAKRPVIPIQSGHRFRFSPATDSDEKRSSR